MIEPTDLDAAPSDEYEIDAPTTGPIHPAAPTPLPRMWKAEDPDADAEDKPKPGKAKGVGSGPPTAKTKGEEPSRRIGDRKESPPVSSSAPARRSTGQEASARESKKPSDTTPDPDKKLVEDTPEWDTYETRRRARLFIGVALGTSFLLFGWLIYRTFIYDPDAIDLTADLDRVQPEGSSAPPDLELEARAMIDRAKEYEKGGRRNQSIALLKKVTEKYSKVPAAKAAKDALARAQLEQPMFPEGPTAALSPDGTPPADPNSAQAIAAAPAQVVPATPLPPEGDQTRPPDAAKGLVAMNRPTPSPAKPGSPTPTPSVAKPATPQEKTPPKPLVRPLPRGFRAKESEGIHESGWPLVIVGDTDEIPMHFIPEGIFVMGANAGPAMEGPAHRVQLRAFYIDRDEVTIARFNQFLDATGYRRILPRNWSPTDGKAKPDGSKPVTMVSFKDAEAYAAWTRKQLPTEAQWEMAGRSNESRLYPWGSDPVDWIKPRVFRQMDPVGTFPQDATRFGVRDMAGNAAEWTQDWFDSRYFQQFSDGIANNPTGPSRASRTLQRVVKGGSKSWNLSYREGVPQEKRLGYLGFRCVLNIESGSSADLTPVVVPGTRPGQPAEVAPPPF